MKKNSIIFCMVTIFSIISVLNAEESEKDEVPKDCGPQCVKYLSRYFSRPVTLIDAFELCGFDINVTEMRYVNMLNLKQALLKLDLHCFGFRGSLKHLKDETFKNCAFIVALEEKEHFIVIARAQKSDNWLWVNPSAKAVWPIKDSFLGKENNYAFLAVSDVPIPVDLAKGSGGKGFKWIYLLPIVLAVFYVIYMPMKSRMISK